MKKEEYVTPFESNYVTEIKENINIEELENIMKDYIGKHDFSSFMKKDKSKRNTVREIYWIKCYYNEVEKLSYSAYIGRWHPYQYFAFKMIYKQLFGVEYADNMNGHTF